jgi:hypothetical protein
MCVELGPGRRGKEALGVVVATSIFDGQGITPKPLYWVLLLVILRDSERFEFLRKKQVAKSCRIGGEAVAVSCFSGHFIEDLVDPVESVVAAMCVAGGVAVRVASASTITAATSSFASAMR